MSPSYNCSLATMKDLCEGANSMAGADCSVSEVLVAVIARPLSHDKALQVLEEVAIHTVITFYFFKKCQFLGKDQLLGLKMVPIPWRGPISWLKVEEANKLTMN